LAWGQEVVAPFGLQDEPEGILVAFHSDSNTNTIPQLIKLNGHKWHDTTNWFYPDLRTILNTNAQHILALPLFNTRPTACTFKIIPISLVPCL